MTPLERYRELYEYEMDCNSKMLEMIESVAEANRSDERFQKAVSLAGHLAACRENWLDRMAEDGSNQTEWYDADCSLSGLKERFAVLQERWARYFVELTDEARESDFSFTMRNGERGTIPIEVQIFQLICHAPYHRGQVALLVDQLGGETVDTDYLYWTFRDS
jgi:uncharacterized damage-inducible protein DinB